MLLLELTLWLIATFAPAPQAAPPRNVDFAKDVRPILEKRCQPCHFEGGKMYAHLPFDKAATVDKLGTQLFTRIKADEEQAVIRAFLTRDRRAAD
ncbi:MAG TPA: hypothetical protein VEK57_15320 [Thermoanaerobaculia bacterium]|nr:hypothetical protein [Thermoanaerobaculia bacterium]